MTYLKEGLLLIVLLIGLHGCLWIGLWNQYNEKLTDQVYQELQEQLKKGTISKEQAVAECERLKAKTEKTNIQCVFEEAAVAGSPPK
ncbi:MAG TPA: hypothetical protein VF879_03055 [Nitrospirales bacterium]